MTEYEKMIELIGQAKAMEASGIECKVSDEYIADYLLTNKTTILPCKPGDTVYWIAPKYPDKIYKSTVHEITFWSYSDGVVDCRLLCKSFRFSDFGKIVFLSEEEAKQALEIAIKRKKIT